MEGWPTPTSLSFAESHQPGNSYSYNKTMEMASGLGSARPTPASRDFKGVDRTEIDRGNARPLNEVVAHWPTPKVLQGGPNSKRAERGAGGPDLQEAVQVWATPTAHERTHTPRKVDHGEQLANQVDQWSTPRASDGEKGGPNQSFGAGGVPLPAQTVGWATPRVSMIKANGNPERFGGRLGQGNIEDQVVRWPTPSVADVTGGRTSRSGDRKDELLLNTMASALASSLPAPETETHGLPSSPERRTLNPRFVEWLMGWPAGWTSFECSATELSRFKADMRSALSQLTSHAAPPAQLSLFG